jgi:hypothetical protein
LNLNRNINEKSTLLTFIEQLKNQGNVRGWQLKQAEAAVKLFFGDKILLQLKSNVSHVLATFDSDFQIPAF